MAHVTLIMHALLYLSSHLCKKARYVFTHPSLAVAPQPLQRLCHWNWNGHHGLDRHCLCNGSSTILWRLPTKPEHPTLLWWIPLWLIPLWWIPLWLIPLWLHHLWLHNHLRLHNYLWLLWLHLCLHLCLHLENPVHRWFTLVGLTLDPTVHYP